MPLWLWWSFVHQSIAGGGRGVIIVAVVIVASHRWILTVVVHRGVRKDWVLLEISVRDAIYTVGPVPSPFARRSSRTSLKGTESGADVFAGIRLGDK